jgi:transcriptional regulator with XRE-family HTH domain
VDIGEFLQAERHAADMSQDAVAALTGMTRSRVSDIENGMHSPTWATVERLLEGMGRRPVLDTRPAEDLFEDPADARVSAMTIEDRFQSAVPLAGFVLDRLGRRGARLALDGPTAATLLGIRVPSPFVHVACPQEDAQVLVEAMADGAAQAWSERFRDFRGGIDDPDQLAAPEPTRWLMRGLTIAVRMCADWHPALLRIGAREVAVTTLEELRQDRDVATFLEGHR